MVAAASMMACSTADKKTTTTGTDTAGNTTPTTNTTPGSTTPTTDNANLTSIEWIDTPVKDLGKLKKDQTIEITWRFRNNGDKPLVIENVTAGCGCTIPEKPQQPFAPGEEGLIKASFNGAGSGAISKSVTVTANTSPNIHNLTFTGDIKEK